MDSHLFIMPTPTIPNATRLYQLLTKKAYVKDSMILYMKYVSCKPYDQD
jgi:hypothetical protein